MVLRGTYDMQWSSIWKTIIVNTCTNGYQTYSLKRLTADSRTSASVDHETQELVLDDWRE